MKLHFYFLAAIHIVNVALASSNNFVNLDIVGTRTNHHPLGRYNKYKDKYKRDEDIAVSLENQFSYYQLDIKAGTPAQTISVLIDTGSSDLWVQSVDNPHCAKNGEEHGYQGYIHCYGISFDMKKSSTFHQNNSDFYIQYADLTTAKGVWGTDIINIGGTSIPNCNFAVATDSNSSESVLGISFSSGESSVIESGIEGYNLENSYPNLPQQLLNQGSIKHLAYSLWLNDLNSRSGQLLFGAVDHDKFNGTLTTVPLVNIFPTISQPIEMTIVLSGIEMNDVNGYTSTVMTGSVAALLDSGSTITYLPESVTEAIYTTLGATYSFEIGEYTIEDCNIRDTKTALIFDLSGAKITVPISELLFQFTFGEKLYCALQIYPILDLDSTITLGDSFLRSAYVVYDLQNYEISIANAKYNITSSNIAIIDSAGVPGATKAPNYSMTKLRLPISAQTATGVFTISPSSTTQSSTRVAITSRGDLSSKPFAQPTIQSNQAATTGEAISTIESGLISTTTHHTTGEARSSNARSSGNTNNAPANISLSFYSTIFIIIVISLI